MMHHKTIYKELRQYLKSALPVSTINFTQHRTSLDNKLRQLSKEIHNTETETKNIIKTNVLQEKGKKNGLTWDYTYLSFRALSI